MSDISDKYIRKNFPNYFAKLELRRDFFARFMQEWAERNSGSRSGRIRNVEPNFTEVEHAQSI